MKRCSLMITLLLYGVVMTAQNYINPVRTDLIPPLPHAARVVEQQTPRPALLTGAADFRLPIYTIEADGFNFPLELHYHSNGIRFFEDPGQFGYGWALLPAMRITRTVLGRPDEFYPLKIEELLDSLTPQRWKLAHQAVYAYPPSGEKYDSQHDIISIALTDRTLTRIIIAKPNRQFEFIGIGDDEYQVFTNDNLKSIHVLDPLGNEYVFGPEAEESFFDGSIHYTFSHTWLLEKIITGSGRAIRFTWGYCPVYNYGTYGGANYVDSYQTYGVPDADKLMYNKAGYLATQWSYSPVGVIMTKNIVKIEFEGLVIDFNKPAPPGIYYRSDNVINEIVISSTLQGLEGMVKKVSLSYDNAGMEGFVLTEAIFSDIGTYKFKYNTTVFSNSDSGAQDAWGFYNGNNENSLTPKISVRKIDVSGNVAGFHPYASYNLRETDDGAMKANLLNTIVYPGGGISVFEYEPHEFPQGQSMFTDQIHGTLTKIDSGGGLRVKRILTYTSENDNSPNEINYLYAPANVRALPTAESFLNIFTGMTAIYPQDSNLGYHTTTRLINVIPQSDYMRYDIGELPLWYGRIEEIHSEGKTVYNFDRVSNESNRILKEFGKRRPLVLSSIFSKGPQLMSVETYKGDSAGSYEKVSEDSYQYETIKGDSIVCAFVERQVVQFGEPNEGKYSPDFKNGDILEFVRGGDINIRWGLDDDDTYPYSIYPYTIHPQTERQTIHIHKEFVGNNSLVSKTTMTFGVSDGLPREITTSSQEFPDKTVHITYPQKRHSDMEEQMIKSHAIGMPIRVETSRDDATTVIEGIYVKYGSDSSNGMNVAATLQWNRDESDSLISHKASYDVRGYTNMLIDPDGCISSFLYGYNGRYPVYKIDGIHIRNIPTTEDVINGNVQSIESLVPDNSLFTQIHYKPFIGISELIEPAGNGFRYEYDTRCWLSRQYLWGGEETHSYYYEGGDGTPFVIEENIYQSKWRRNYETVTNKYDGLNRLDYTSYLIRGSNIYQRYDKMGRISGDALTSGPRPADFQWTDYGYEPSPRGVKTSSCRPGARWKTENRRITTSRRINGEGDKQYECENLTVGRDGSIIHHGLFMRGSVMMESTTDEDGHYVITATNSDGQMILRREGTGSEWLSTYYVYDNYGRLRYILPPNLEPKSYAAGDVGLEEYAYQYSYSGSGRVTWSSTPGTGRTDYVYTPAGRIFATSDPILGDRFFRVHLYDKYGRETVTGVAYGTRAEMTALSRKACAVGTASGDFPIPYDLSAFGLKEFRPECVRVYDGYHRSSHCFMPDSLTGEDYLREPKGLLTSMINYYDRDAYYRDTYFYDSNARNIQTCSDPGGYMMCKSTSYTLQGMPKTELLKVTEAKTDSLHTLLTQYRYDDAGRNVLTIYTLDGKKMTRTKTDYDDLGRIKNHFVGSCRQEFSYDERNWLTNIQTTLPEVRKVEITPQPWHAPGADGLSSAYYTAASGTDGDIEWGGGPEVIPKDIVFDEYICYDDGGHPKFNGTPSAWGNTMDGRYEYKYDAFERLIAADYIPNSNKPDEDFSACYEYDELGRPVRLKRWGVVDFDGDKEVFGLLDDVFYEYNGAALTDYWCNSESFEGDFFYGRTGLSLTSGSRSYEKGKLSKEIGGGYVTTYHYDLSGLPLGIVKKQNSQYTVGSVMNLTCIHDCHGTLLSKTLKSKSAMTERTLSERHYAGCFTFGASGILRVDFPGGYFDGNGKCHYFLTDRLGSVYVVANDSNKIEERYGYYPYGEQWRNTVGQPIRFASKEREGLLPVGDYNFGPRLYRPSIAYWDNVDRFSGNTPWHSPYAYCGANPVANREIDGNWYIKVSSSADRGLYPYAIMTLYSTYDEAIYATVVKVRGRHRVRNVLYGDTPQGYSKITGWKTNDNVLSFGPNPYLQLDYQPGQEGGTRNAMQMHGGQEEKRKILNELIGTLGCIRITDEDLVEVKQIVDALEMGLPNERPEFVWVIDDLEFPVRYQDREEIKAIPIINLPEIVVPANKDRDLNIEGK